MGLLIAQPHPPIVLTAIIFVQASVFLCSPISAFWNIRAQRVPAHEYRARYREQQLRRSRRFAPNFVTVGFLGALVLAILGGLGIAVFSAPSKLAPVRAATAPAGTGTTTGGVGTVTPVAQPAAASGH